MSLFFFLNLEADLSGASKQRLGGQVRVGVGAAQVRGATCGFDGHLVGRRWSQPGWGVRRRAEAAGIHGRIIEVLVASALSLAIQSPVWEQNKCTVISFSGGDSRVPHRSEVQGVDVFLVISTV